MSDLNYKIISMNPHQFSDSFSTFGFRCPKPFLNLDIFHMSAPTFPPHPHSGFSAITYLFPTSKGQFQNRDSHGDKSVIESGGLHWTQAASGMLHEEIPILSGTDCYGLQMFIKLPQIHELEDGKAFHLSPSEIALHTETGLNLKILTGEYQNKKSNLTEIHPAVDFYDITLEKQAKLQLPTKRARINLLVCLEGEIQILDETKCKAHEILIVQDSETTLEIVGSSETNQFLFLSADALKEDYTWGGPFCLSSVERLNDAQIRFQQGKMGNLTRSF
ncbi:MAG: pirin family protein [Leptospira sp.]|nr:pirin family protein [Leptospira sp.]